MKQVSLKVIFEELAPIRLSGHKAVIWCIILANPEIIQDYTNSYTLIAFEKLL